MGGQFHNIINKSIIDEMGNKFIQVRHNSKIHKVEFVFSEQELLEAKEFDDQYFKGSQRITIEELRDFRDFGCVLVVRDENTSKVAGVSQILLSSIRQQEVRPGEAFSYGTAGRGFGQILYKAQEVAAREEGKTKIRLTVRVENTESIRAQLKAGFRIVEYDPTRYGFTENDGARLIMEKDLLHENFPFDPVKNAKMVKDSAIPIIIIPEELDVIIYEKPARLATAVYNEDKVNLTSHRIIERLTAGGYIGTTLIQPEEYGEEPGPKKLIIFQRSDLPPRVENLTLPLKIDSEFRKLREVIVSYTPENAQIKEEYAINDVAKKNVNNIDPIAFKDEYNLFIGTLVAQNIRIVHTNAIGKDGKSAIFTRDPAFVIENHFVMGRLVQNQRGYESDSMRQLATGTQFLDLTKAPHAYLEGGDVIIIDDKTIAVGIGQRTNEAGFIKLQQTFPDYQFIKVYHKHLHLDVLFTMLGKRRCLADISQLPNSFIEYLKNKIFCIIEAEPAEQETLGCNVVAIDENRVITVKENTVTNQRLMNNGVKVIEVSMPNVVKWGGGPRCMTCPTARY
jgi:N-dimethylarginine dimethylaminohydrolase